MNDFFSKNKHIYIFGAVFAFLLSFFAIFQFSYAQGFDDAANINPEDGGIVVEVSGGAEGVSANQEGGREAGEKKGFFSKIFIAIKNLFAKDERGDANEGCEFGGGLDCLDDPSDIREEEEGCAEGLDENCERDMFEDEESREECADGIGDACDDAPGIEDGATDDSAAKEAKKDEKEDSGDKGTFGGAIVNFFLRVFGLEGAVIDSGVEKEADCEYAYERILELEDEWDELFYTSKTRDFDVEAEKERILKEFVKFDRILNENCFEDEIYDSFLVDEAYGGKKEEDDSDSGEASDVIYIDEKGNIIDEAETENEDGITVDIDEEGNIVIDGIGDADAEDDKKNEKEDGDKVACSMPKKISAITYPFEYRVLDDGHVLVRTVYTNYCGVGSKEEFEKIAEETRDAIENQLSFSVGNSCLSIGIEEVRYVDVKTPGCFYVLHSKTTEADEEFDFDFDFLER